MASQRPDTTLFCSTRARRCLNRTPGVPQMVSAILPGTSIIQEVVSSGSAPAYAAKPAGAVSTRAPAVPASTRKQAYEDYDQVENFEDEEETEVVYEGYAGDASYEGFEGEEEEVVYEETYEDQVPEDLVY